MEKRPLIVEIIGLPGVGKTTLVNALLKKSSKLQLERTPFFREWQYIPYFAWNTLLSIPDFLQVKRTEDRQWLSLRDMALMVILKGWHLALERERLRSQNLLVLDEGPICYLTRLYAFGSDALKSSSAEPWWEAACRKWAKTLDLVIKLDTTDPLLIERIRSRNAPQIVKELSDFEALKYMKNHRNAQDHAVGRIMSQPVHPTMECFDTTQKLPVDLADDLVNLLAL